jgi:serine/threonine protein kinase
MQRQRRLKDEQIAYVFNGICEGIKYIHDLNVLHRDLKPENILFDENYKPKLADFGFACKISAHERRNTICGTREYFSPEIFTYKNQSLALDIWCLGVLLYELCHSKVPFKMTSFSFKEAADQIKKQKYR